MPSSTTTRPPSRWALLESITLNSKSPQVVTYKIKAAAKWADGKPVSADDIIFTQQTIMNPKWSISSRVGNEDIGRIRKVDAKTVRITFKKPFVAYKELWGKLLPAHPQERGARHELRPGVAQRAADLERPLPLRQLEPR